MRTATKVVTAVVVVGGTKERFRVAFAPPDHRRRAVAVVVDVRGVDNAGAQILPLEECGRGEVDGEQDGEEEQGQKLHPDDDAMCAGLGGELMVVG